MFPTIKQTVAHPPIILWSQALYVYHLMQEVYFIGPSEHKLGLQRMQFSAILEFTNISETSLRRVHDIRVCYLVPYKNNFAFVMGLNVFFRSTAILIDNWTNSSFGVMNFLFQKPNSFKVFETSTRSFSHTIEPIKVTSYTLDPIVCCQFFQL